MLMQVPGAAGGAAAAAAAGGASDPVASSRSHATWVLEDRFAEDYTTPALTSSPPPAQRQQQNHQQPPPKKTLLSVQTRPAEQAVAFTSSMPLSACIVPRSRPTFVMWASGPVTPPTAAAAATAATAATAAEPQHHGPHKGSTSLLLRSSPLEWQAFQVEQQAALSVPAPALSFTVALPLMDVPEVETRYMCMYVAPPQEEKCHIYRVVRKGKEEVSRAYVHHIFVFNAGDDEVRKEGGREGGREEGVHTNHTPYTNSLPFTLPFFLLPFSSRQRQ